MVPSLAELTKKRYKSLWIKYILRKKKRYLNRVEKKELNANGSEKQAALSRKVSFFRYIWLKFCLGQREWSKYHVQDSIPSRVNNLFG